jgi:hypothetical protein
MPHVNQSLLLAKAIAIHQLESILKHKQEEEWEFQCVALEVIFVKSTSLMWWSSYWKWKINGRAIKAQHPKKAGATR